MKLLAAVLVSILLAFSVATANTVLPSVTTSTYFSSCTVLSSTTTSTDPSSSTALSVSIVNIEFSSGRTFNADLINQSIFSVEVKNMVNDYLQKKHDYGEAIKIRNSARDTVVVQKQTIAELNERYQQLKRKSQKSKNALKHKSRLDRLKLELENQSSRVFRLQKHMHALEYEHDQASLKLEQQGRRLADIFLGEFPDASRISLRVDLEPKPVFITLADNLPNNLPNSIPNRSSRSIRNFFSKIQTRLQKTNQNTDLPPSYKRVMRKPERYKVTQQGPVTLPPSYEQVIMHPENFDKVLKDPGIQYPPLEEMPIVQPIQSTSRTSSSLQRTASSLQRGTSRLVHNVGSFFQQPRNDDSPV
ncbi:hypothetical protein BATDEDRAFT_86556 [Batrachochytrium dendrobatidis JAM81]|uniref:Uncharacterized protein n=1 Tax=Batrachochytrium dendrobatidis (strain JAM81 / FGSC 10211) TaxID=684364 RepID=F4NX30_BATDJ|nr:uncharacterized protein BATDEDRAFT_86556 [Batrachochytrium dendrobatidis JAM81]EGF82286.1 hypothetical protein BATDEDRAFT_86556 [Batrachochytrium dendrobatidis JAM81]|eukprot:XP_006676868.1 hypothetical protein BATDEDRAFT_86556 [Batrachochytrium dendrobatidis JAM81]